ncbi:MAG: hypothetical protein EOO98_00435 [Pedobacter sp.]|nr:MAG: hypothetical protein EOO98_00435 [Pedobacter sp.]
MPTVIELFLERNILLGEIEMLSSVYDRLPADTNGDKITLLNDILVLRSEAVILQQEIISRMIDELIQDPQILKICPELIIQLKGKQLAS